MDIEKFGEIMDNFLKENRVQLFIELPEGTIEPEIEDNTGLGPVVQLYILMQTMKEVIRSVWEISNKDDERLLDPGAKADFLESTFRLIKSELMEGEHGEQ